MALTLRQRKVLDFVAEFISRQGYSPSYEEIAAGMELASLATVHKHLTTLCNKGYLKRGANQSRSLDLGPQYFTDQRRQRQQQRPVIPPAFDVPLLGRVAAGALHPTEQQSSESLSFADFLGQPQVFATQVHGESMIEDHILPGDYVLVERIDQPRDGDIVVALHDGETTLKRFYREPQGMARLQPANAAMSPLHVPLSSLSIQGRVLAVHRRYR